MKKISKHKSKFATITLVLVLSIASTLIVCLPPVTAQDATATVAHLSVRPNPVGVGQTILINIWLTPSLHRSRAYPEMYVTFTDPDGNEDVVGPMESYGGDGTAWLEYVPDQVGTWKLQFEFLGHTFPGEWVPGGFFEPPQVWLDEATYLASVSPVTELVVQDDPIPSFQETPIPYDEYWERPISPDNREWYRIAGDWLQVRYNGSQSCFNPYSEAPDSAHIVWKMRTGPGGIIGGGDFGTSGVYDPDMGGQIIMNGILYLDAMGGFFAAPTTTCTAIDIRTGEILWQKEINRCDVGWPGNTPYLVDLGSTVTKYNAWTGEIAAEHTGMSGSVDYPYVYSRETVGSGPNQTRRLIKWTLDGTTDNFASRIIYNVSYPMELGSSWVFTEGTGVTQTFTATGWSGGFDTESGTILWSRQIEPWEQRYTGWQSTVGYGKIFTSLYHPETTGDKLRTHAIYNARTGDLLYKCEQGDYPWGTFMAYQSAAAYGNFYSMHYDGIHAYDADTGDEIWQYSAGNSGFETPYNTWPFFSFSYGTVIADGKLYSSNEEHSPTDPLLRGMKLHCVDAHTGEGIWNISGSMNLMSIADGYLLAFDDYTKVQYCFGIGKSATTVSAPQTAIPLGQSIVLTGTVLDQSPAQPGTPCVSKESMAAWMEYLHMQKPIPAEVTGVPVSLDTIDPNGNFIHIGDATTDMSGTFGFMWTPEVPGKYTVMATFMGDDSYASSFAETHVGVVEAPEPPPEPVTPATEPEVQEDIDRAVNNLMPILYGTIVAVVIAIVIGIISLLDHRRLRK